MRKYFKKQPLFDRRACHSIMGLRDFCYGTVRNAIDPVERAVSDWRDLDGAPDLFPALFSLIQTLNGLLSPENALSRREFSMRFIRLISIRTNDIVRNIASELSTVRYFAAAVFYAKAIKAAAAASSDSINTLTLDVSLDELDHVASGVLVRKRKMLLLDAVATKDGLIHEVNDIHIPGMLVLKPSKNKLVSVMLNRQLGGNSTPVIASEDLKLETGRYCIISNDGTFEESADDRVVLQHDNVFERRVLQFLSNLNLRVTWISVYNNNGTKEFQIETTFFESSSSTRLPISAFKAVAGISELDIHSSKQVSKCSPYDILVTVFSDILFGYRTSTPDDAMRLEEWATGYLCRLDARFSRSAKGKDMENDVPYLGVCFETLYRGLQHPYPRNISANLLLLSLTRGFRRIFEVDKSSIDSLIGDAKQQASIVCVANARDLHDRIWEKHIVGASRHGITVRTRYPRDIIFILVVTLSLTVTFFLIRIKKSSTEDVVSTSMTFFSVCMLCTTLYMKAKYRRWELVEALRRERTAKKLSEIEAVVDGRKQAIQIVGTIDHPETVMSRWKSCAFSHFESDAVDQGEFEVDIDLTVGDLEMAGFSFGLDYAGNLVMANLKGELRRVEMADEEEENNRLHVGRLHSIHTHFIVGNVITQKGRKVGGTRSLQGLRKARYDENV